MAVADDDRWPPVYDADDLIEQIESLRQRSDFLNAFFDWRADRSMQHPEDVCQGDIVQMVSDVPLIDREGKPSAMDHPTGTWLVLGNTCDFDRPLDVVQWTQLAPIMDYAADNSSEAAAVTQYTTSRTFHVPHWRGDLGARCFVADLLRPVAVDKRVFGDGNAKVVARVSRPAWILLNACLVRFLARDDGRHAA